jgi:hypothetical protein
LADGAAKNLDVMQNLALYVEIGLGFDEFNAADGT